MRSEGVGKDGRKHTGVGRGGGRGRKRGKLHRSSSLPEIEEDVGLDEDEDQGEGADDVEMGEEGD